MGPPRVQKAFGEAMTPEDLTLLKKCLSQVNHHRSGVRLDAEMGFRYLNKKYSRPKVDAAVAEIKGGKK